MANVSDLSPGCECFAEHSQAEELDGLEPLLVFLEGAAQLVTITIRNACHAPGEEARHPPRPQLWYLSQQRQRPRS